MPGLPALERQSATRRFALFRTSLFDYIIDTHMHPDHTGGNEALAKLGNTIAGGNVVGDIGASAGNQATVVAAQEVLDRMSEPDGNRPPAPQGAWPTETYTTPERIALSSTARACWMIHRAQAAHTDGDTMVFFRRSDVISTGDIFVTNRCPIVDMERGGNIQGVIAGLNRIIDLAIPADEQEGGTLLMIPGHGRLCRTSRTWCGIRKWSQSSAIASRIWSTRA